jgi:hypothetical protein
VPKIITTPHGNAKGATYIVEIPKSILKRIAIPMVTENPINPILRIRFTEQK